MCAPILVNLLVKTFVFSPVVEHLWNAHQNEIFINSYQEDRALLEMQNFSEKVFFESLLGEAPAGNDVQPSLQDNESSYSSPQVRILCTVRWEVVSPTETLFRNVGK